MRAKWFEIAEEVIRKANREHPADGVLRMALKKRSGLDRIVGTHASTAVFAFYRWRGWLDGQASVLDQVEQAMALQRKFKESRDTFDDEDVLGRAVPSWIRSEWFATTEWALALQGLPRLWLRARKGQGSTLAQTLGDCRPVDDAFSLALPDTLEYLGFQDLFRAPSFHAGEFEIQDITSQIVGHVCDPQPRSTWWDACAGEGGKLLHLADLMDNRGLIWASDCSERRLAMLRRRAARAKVFNYRAILWDNAGRLPTRTRFDGVLVDAPCSGVGTWHRNPHARWTSTAEDVQRLAALQVDLLLQTKSAVKKGGRLIYSVCTLTQAETRGVAQAFAKAAPEFKRAVPVDSAWGRYCDEDGVWLLPQQIGGNGMFVTCWQHLV